MEHWAWAAAWLGAGALTYAADLAYQWAVWRELAPFPSRRRMALLSLAAWPVVAAVVAIRVARHVDDELETRKRSH